MARKDRGTLAERIAGAAEAALAAQDYVCCIDVMERIGWLYPEAAKRWRVGQFECLEDAVQSNPSRISEAMRLFQNWAEAKGLIANETQYVARTPQREALRFSRSGDCGDRTLVPDALGIAQPCREPTPTPDGESQPRSGVGGHPAIE